MSYQFANMIKYHVYYFFANGVMASGVIVGSILLPSYQLLWVKQLSVCSSSNLIWMGKNMSKKNRNWLDGTAVQS